MHFGHLLTAMVTPFDANNKVNFQAMTLVIERLINTGTDCIVVTGTTGESPVLSVEEMAEIFEHVVTVVNNRVRIIAGTGTNNTEQSIMLSKIAESANVDGIMLVTPYYNRPNQRGLYAHFSAIAQATRLPIMLYNIPIRSSVHLELETIIKLSEIDNIVALKDSTGNLNDVSEIVKATKDNFYVYSGDDSLTIPLMSVGAVGVVSVASHLIGTELKEMIDAFLSGNTAQALRMHQQLLPVMKGLFIAPNPTPVKAALTLAGIDVGNVRLPLVPLTADEKNKLEKIVHEYL